MSNTAKIFNFPPQALIRMKHMFEEDIQKESQTALDTMYNSFFFENLVKEYKVFRDLLAKEDFDEAAKSFRRRHKITLMGR